MSELSITIMHRIPGRVRLRLDRVPADIKKFIDDVKKHEGIEKISFNPISKSLIVEYGPSVISSVEIIIRASISLSESYNSSGVIIKNNTIQKSMTNLDYYSGASLLLAAAAKGAMTPETTAFKYLEYNAGISTMLSVFNHAWDEVKREGIYDPEVVSVVYLINALIKGNIVSAGLITWAATFGRHLFDRPEEKFILNAVRSKNAEGKDYLDVTIKPIGSLKNKSNPLRVFVLGLGKMVGMKDNHSHSRLLDQIKQMSRKHGNILEGMGNNPGPVYMRI